MGRPHVGGEGLPRSRRVRQGAEIRAILRRGARNRSESLDVFSAPGVGESARFGTIVPKFGRTIVDRNRLRRRLREIGRTEVLPPLRARTSRCDVLVRAHPRAYDLSFDELRTELLRLTKSLCSDASSSA